MGIRGGEFMEGGKRCVCNWMKTSPQNKKKKASVLLVRSLIYAVVGLSWVHLFFLVNDALKFQED